MSSKPKPVPGHKFKRVCFATSCECGWTSFTAPTRTDAYNEFRYHTDQHRRVLAGEIPCACGGAWNVDKTKFNHVFDCRSKGGGR